MNKALGSIAALVLAGAAAFAGYWYGQRGAQESRGPQAEADAAATFAPVKKERKLLYYRNPMGLPDISPTPKKDQMGMDYIPVYEGEEAEASSSVGSIRISTEKVQKLGVRAEPVARRALDAVVRAAGRVEVDERRVFAIAPKFEGWIERLYVNSIGQAVGKGQPLFDAYSPELLATQSEYAVAAQGLASLKDADAPAQAGMKRLADAALARLRNWDVTDEQLKELARSGEARRALTFRAPVGGIVLEKKALQGMRFMPGEMLYQIADLSTVWVIADVPEQDIARVKIGASAKVQIGAFVDRTFSGRVTFVYPTLTAATRTVPVRLELANPGGLLKPSMFAQVELVQPTGAAKLVVPNSAVIDSGTRRVVLVQTGGGRFEPRDVRLGQRGSDYVEVLDGVKEGESVVVAANFLIDAESNLKAALGGLTAPGAETATEATVSHRTAGKVDEIDSKTGAVTVTHDRVPSLKWPAMTMEFKAANDALLKDLQPGARIEFEFVERKPGEWVIVRVERVKSAPGEARRR